MSQANGVQQPGGGIAVFATAPYPDSSAAACRLTAVCQLLKAAGLDPSVASGQDAPKANAPLSEFPFHSMGEVGTGRSKLGKAFRHLTWGNHSRDWFDLNKGHFTHALIAGGYTPYTARFLPLCRRSRTPLLIDAVEWFQPSHMPGGSLGPFTLNIELAMRWLYPKAGNIIAISRLLQRHFEAKGCNVLYLPAVLDVFQVEPRIQASSGGGRLKLAYTGTPGKKDLLDPLIEAVLRLDPGGTRIQVTLAGPTLGYLLGLPALQKRGLRELPPGLIAPGYVSQAEANAMVRDADFSVLLRHRQRYAMAGFPTKVPESLAVGTPVICNLTSDLGDYLVDGSQALICDGPNAEACQVALERALAKSPEAREAMRRQARELAERSFDYRQYASEMGDFLKALKPPR